jgi:hypothetical protein
VWEKSSRSPLGIRKKEKNERGHEREETPKECLFRWKVYKETLSYCSVKKVWIRDRPPSAYTSFSLGRRKIRLIEDNAKCRHLKKIDLYRDFAAGVYLFLPRFCLGWCSNFAGSESGQMQSVKLLQNMVSNSTPQYAIPPPLHTVPLVSLCSTCQREKV